LGREWGDERRRNRATTTSRGRKKGKRESKKRGTVYRFSSPSYEGITRGESVKRCEKAELKRRQDFRSRRRLGAREDQYSFIIIVGGEGKKQGDQTPIWAELEEWKRKPGAIPAKIDGGGRSK